MLLEAVILVLLVLVGLYLLADMLAARRQRRRWREEARAIRRLFEALQDGRHDDA